jgi:hypothetical protein
MGIYATIVAANRLTNGGTLDATILRDPVANVAMFVPPDGTIAKIVMVTFV